MSRYHRTIGLALLVLFIITAGTAVSQPLSAELISTGYGLIGDTLYTGSLILDGFVKGHSVELRILAPSSSAEYNFYRTPYGETDPDVITGWIPVDSVEIDGGGDGEIFKHSASAANSSDTVDTRYPLWLMHDWYRPDRVDVEHTAYGDDAPIPYIDLRWSRGTDSASGVYFYLIYRALNEWDLSYITDTMFPIDTVWESGAPGYIYRDYGVTPGVRYFYKIIPVDKAGWIRRSENNTIIGKAQPAPSMFPPCAFLEVLPRYHSGSGITVNIDHTLCPARPDVEYRYLKREVIFVDGVPEVVPSTEDSSDWTSNDYYFWNTDTCKTYTFSAKVREIDYIEHGWTDLTSFRILSTNDDIPPDCPDTFSAVSLGEDGILVNFTHHAENDCGSGTMGYYLYRVEDTDWGVVLDEGTDPSVGWETALEDHILWTYPIDPSDPHYTFQDDGPTDPVIDLEDEACYYYLVCPYDSAGNVSWFNCPYIGGQLDTACVDKGVGAPVAISLDFPEYVTDSVIVWFKDTTHCDAVSVVIQWARSIDFTVGFSSTDPLPIMDPASGPPVWEYENTGTAGCADEDLLKFTFYSEHENTYYFRAKFIDDNENHSEWSTPLLSTTFDNTPPNAVAIHYMHSIATDVNDVKVRLTWPADSISDAGIGVQGVKIYRSDAEGTLGSEIANLTPTTHEYYDMAPDPGDNWHNNVYTIVPYDGLGHENTTGTQKFFPTLAGSEGMNYHPPLPPEILEVNVSPYLDSFTVVWNDTGPGHMVNRYTLRHSASLTGLWSPDPLLRVEVNVGAGSRKTFPIEDLIGGLRHYFTMYARDTRTPSNQSGWSEVFEYELSYITATCTLHCARGYNLVSLPVVPGNNNPGVIFPGCSEIWEWDHFAGVYLDASDSPIEPGKAYWILVSDPTDFIVSGIPVTRIAETMSEWGWWTVGACYDTVPMGFEFTGGNELAWGWNTVAGEYYELVDSLGVGLESGYGYWLLAEAPGNFYTEPEMPLSKFAPDNIFLNWKLPILAGDKALTIAYSSFADVGYDDYDKPEPPVSPYGEVEPSLIEDDNLRYSTSVRPDGEWKIVLPRETELSWDPNAVPPEGLTLIANDKSIDMRSIGYASAIGNAKIISGDALPSSYVLDPVHPNPFNPTCEIPFSLPEASEVTIEIFDITGRQIITLADRDYDAGRYSVKWHGVDEIGREMPGGLYLCRMKAGSFVETRRMLLLK